MTKHSTGLYIKHRNGNKYWECFLGGYSYTKPSVLWEHYRQHFPELQEDYECTVLERRPYKWKGRTALFRVGSDVPVMYQQDDEELIEDDEVPEVDRYLVECLSIWHMDEPDRMFMGHKHNRICDKCYLKEKNFMIDRGRQW